MYPWDIGTENNKPKDEFIIPLWESFKRKDFYFSCVYQKDNKHTVVYIVPVEYFEKTGLMYYDSIPIAKLLPEYLEEITDCIYETARNPDFVIYNFSKLGFSRSFRFDKFIKRTMEMYNA